MQQPSLHFSTRRFASVLATSIPKPPVYPRLFATTPISRRERPEKLFATGPSHRLFTSTRTKMTPAQSATVQFYTGGSLDPSSPFDTLEKILTTWSDRTLEARHDYIQHLFPLPERSPVNPEAPVITKEVRDAFLDPGSQGTVLREGLQKAFGRMCKFYGFVLDESQGTIAKASNFHERAPDSWLTTIDHNHLRITRIIRCMRILGMFN
ncbi:hypothetical protein D0864_10440 [Hortaea werneckii]|uniref:Opioid growth factor receptor (OGFr) conserved domain-containing protein n=1 Tax=Hortaea werneckii TaxID=91943 RepID=A0A3M7E8G7_HORWE|nr:hypothetical protein D0864_10440 [Hortaea werneckii]